MPKYDNILKKGLQQNIIEFEKHNSGSKMEDYFRFRRLFEHMQEGVAIHKLVYNEKNIPIDYKVISVNPAFEKITGIPREQAEGSRGSVLYSTGAAPLLDVYAKVAATQSPDLLDIYWPPMKKHFRLSVFSSFPDHFTTIFYDISGMKASEKSLKKSNERFRNLVESTSDLIWEVNHEGAFTYASPQIKDILGYDQTEFLDKTLFDLRPDHKRERIETILGELLKQKKPIERLINIVLHKNGNEVILETSGVPFFDETGNLSGYRGIDRDITIRETQKIQLEKSENKFKTLFHESPAALARFSMETYSILECNNQFSRLFCYADTRDCMTHFVLNERFKSQTGFQDLKSTIKKGINLQNHEIQLLRKDNSEAFISLTLSINKKDRLIETAMIDMSELQYLREQTQQADKLRALGQLAGGIAHDFNNQLAGITGFADILISELSSSPELARYAQNILTASHRSSDLISKLLAFARRGKYLSIPVDLHSILKEVIEILSRTVDRRISIKHDFSAKIPTTLGDPSQLQNAFLNLGLNARDAMPNGGTLFFATSIVSIIDASQQQKDILPEGDYIRITISDTGIGIPKNILPHIFEPFFTTKKKGIGAGMGLAAVYGTIKNHRGTIYIENKESNETIFTILLPLSEGGLMSSEQSITPKKKHLPPSHILIVDDEPILLEMASTMLSRLGCSVDVAENGRKAIDIYKEKKNTINVVILDMIMPVLDGIETFIELKKINPDIKVLLASGFSLDANAQILLSDGVAGFLQKPYRMQELYNKLSTVLEQALK